MRNAIPLRFQDMTSLRDLTSGYLGMTMSFHCADPTLVEATDDATKGLRWEGAASRKEAWR